RVHGLASPALGLASRVHGPVSRVLGLASRVHGPVSRVLGPVSRVHGPVATPPGSVNPEPGLASRVHGPASPVHGPVLWMTQHSWPISQLVFPQVATCPAQPASRTICSSRKPHKTNRNFFQPPRNFGG
ncbi:MAG: hypothetical protein WCK35_28705, partial [Chloroflexota bacterium]